MLGFLKQRADTLGDLSMKLYSLATEIESYAEKQKLAAENTNEMIQVLLAQRSDLDAEAKDAEKLAKQVQKLVGANE
jgi:ABC-type transporter Mla subunit MlaD